MRRVPECGEPDEAQWDESAVGRRYYLHPAEGGVCLLGCNLGCAFTEGRGLGTGPNIGNAAAIERSGASDRGTPLCGQVWCITPIAACYASGEYVRMLRKHQMIPSMRRPANPYDNASCESFMKTLKRFTLTSIGTLNICGWTSSSSSIVTTIDVGYIPSSAINRRKSSKRLPTPEWYPWERRWVFSGTRRSIDPM